MKKSHPLHVEELSPALTPERLPRSLFETPYFFLLDSSLPGERGRYSIAAFDPLCVIEAEEGENFLETLGRHLSEAPVIEAPELPFAGGWIGYLGYEAYSHLEKKVPPREPDLIPKAVFCLYDTFYLYDHFKSKAFFYSLGSTATGRDSLRLLRNSSPHLNPGPSVVGPLNPYSLRHQIDCTWLRQTGPRSRREPLPLPYSNFSREGYLQAIRRIKNYIAAGDCYQVNLSQRFSCDVPDDPYSIYQRLRLVSPAPYAAYLNFGPTQILSSSPESFLEVNGREVVTRPIKGTRPRGQTEEEDRRLRKELEKSVKDHAELLMITDLERNDLGRVCRPGSVSVPELCRIETFAQVHHLVATIQGELPPDKNAVDLLKATFPGGSVTGAPKIRAMQIIRELEPVPRNVYCGAIGYLSRNGKAQFNIAIRTMVYQPLSLSPGGRGGGEGGRVYFSAGGGIVADSDPVEEYKESLTKAEGMMRALDPGGRDHLDDSSLEKLGEEKAGQEPRHHKHIVDPDRVEVG